MSLKLKGKLTKILDPESGTSKAGKEWKKQSFVIDTGDQYNPEVCFSLFGEDKINDNLSDVKIGTEVAVLFNASSREFKGKYYHSLDAWKIVTGDESERPDGLHQSSEFASANDDTSDLPF